MEKYREAMDFEVRLFERSKAWTDTVEKKLYAKNALRHSIDAIVNVAMYDNDLSLEDFNSLLEEGGRIKHEAEQ